MAIVIPPASPASSSRRWTRTTLVPLALAVLSGALLMFGRSYPGFPVAVALAVLVSALVALLLAGVLSSRGAAHVAVLAVVAVILVAGGAVTTLVGHRPLQIRWSASAADFEAYVAQLPPPSTFTADRIGASFLPFPAAASCPAQIGRLPLSGCVSLDSGFLFLQAADAITDSSGIAYLPEGNDAARTGLDPVDLTPLGGPWWSWTCHC